MKNRTLAVNALIAALYIVVTMLVAPLSFSNIQFRLSEMFNHLVVFNKKYFFGIIVGVFLANLFFSPNPALDLVFGFGQSVIALLITIFSCRFIKGIWARMAVNTVVFTFTMFLIAWELNIAMKWPFFATWLTVAIGEFVVMAVGAPLMVAINKRLNFEKLVD
ncbi:QueT transporter family protein [Neobacillus notoginsengisoli]|uniref:QueT transporter family protein n=1 Tax=Neobacillus notoginsengisoli TaxID=1578198 RepID=A0A417YVN9_9BACI|nr:QueT transporter family protein [Neobacillus notoginsengisoli]RHW41460.1 QueT transporter family protein [Neobacillus notoginsengisoli]